MMIERAIAKIAEREDLTRQEAFGAMNEIMSGQADQVQIAGFLIGLRLKGETANEIVGCAEVMREQSVKIATKHQDVIDTCGTGGDGSGTFNISTTAAIIASAAGVPVAKHGNRSVSSACGSADVLKELGVRIDLDPAQVSRVLDDVGISFLNAPLLHTAMKHAAPVRKMLGVRTIFNILGPLTNPAGARRQIVGVFSPQLTGLLAEVLRDLGSDHALVVHGGGGLDELSTLGITEVSEVRKGVVRTYSLDASESGLPVRNIDEVRGGDAATNARIIRSILDCKNDAPKEISILNAGAAIYVGGRSRSMGDGIAMARETLESGRAKAKLTDWIQATQDA